MLDPELMRIQNTGVEESAGMLNPTFEFRGLVFIPRIGLYNWGWSLYLGLVILPGIDLYTWGFFLPGVGLYTWGWSLIYTWDWSL
jgi:hypothetical protein